MTVTWGITICFGLDDTPPADAFDALLDGLELIADNDDPTLRAVLVTGEEPVELGTVKELVETL